MKITYETHYRSKREDGRFNSTMAAFMEKMRNTKPLLSLPDDLTEKRFLLWKEELRNKVKEILLIPEKTDQPTPKKLSSIKRDTYTVEKWEFYPDDYFAVPFLILIPDTATADNPVPGVLCFPGSTASKEFLAGEPLLNKAQCTFSKYPDRGKMAYHYVKSGMVAFAFDNPETAECALDIERDHDWGYSSRIHLCHGLIQMGLCYYGLSVFQKMCALDFIKSLPYVDKDRLAVSGHSLGCEDAMHLGLLSDDIKAIVVNDLVCDERHRYYSTTEYDEKEMCNSSGVWHEIPSVFKYYTRPDILAALAPKYLALNEGGCQYHLDKISRAFKTAGAEDRLQITHYPKFQDESLRSKQYEPIKYGYTELSYFEYTNTDAPDHSFRAEPSINLLRKAFSYENNGK